MNAVLQEFLQAQDYFDSLTQGLLRAYPGNLASLNRELLAAYSRLEDLARAVAGMEVGTPGFAEVQAD